jgi:hypothetical protein
MEEQTISATFHLKITSDILRLHSIAWESSAVNQPVYTIAIALH